MRRLELICIAAVFVVAWVAWTGIALAHDRDDGRYYHGGSFDARQHGYEHGYRDGFHHGQEDRERGASYDGRSKDYKDGDRGYEKFMGDKGHYKTGYREGYLAGYDDAYRRRSGRFGDIYGHQGERYRDGDRDARDDVYENRRWGYSDVAYDIGYRDGVEAGRSDLRKNKDHDPEGQHDYREADHGYRSSYGSKEPYRQLYRTGFMQGYEDGFGRWR